MNGEKMYKHLFTPVKIGNLEIKNRLVVPAMATQYCTADGKATERFIAYHEAKAKGGWGLIITENYSIDPYGGAFVKVPGLWTDDQMESHRHLVDRVHKQGAKICCQIYHAGRAAHPKVAHGHTVAPSAIRDATRLDLPRELTMGEIHEIVERFGVAALRAKQIGFDMVELHGAHGYLITQFLSSFSNKRADKYGGPLYNRCRFLLEVIENVRAKVGDEFPVQLRISAVEGVDGGLDLGETRAIAQLVEAAGVDSIHVSQGNHASSERMIPPYAIPRAAFVDNAAAVKEVVSVPVIGVGRINDPLIAEAVLASGKMDLVAMGRASLADPEMPNKVREGRLEDIRYCIGCLQGCVGRSSRDGIRCLANPELGHEYEDPRRPAEAKKTVLVAGGGIAGCEASILAAQKGHTVSLWEAGPFLGGQWNAAAMPPGKAEFQTILFRQRTQLEKLGVEIRLNSPVTEESLKREKPDVLLVATGSTAVKPPIPGIDSAQVVLANDVLLSKVKVGKNVVIIGGGLVGAETADFAAQQSSKVSIIELLPQIAKDGEAVSNLFLFANLRKYGVNVFTEARCKEIGGNYVTFEMGGETKTLEGVDQVIAAAGVRTNNTLAALGGRLGIRTISIGDAAGIKDGLHNIWEAFDAVSVL